MSPPHKTYTTAKTPECYFTQSRLKISAGEARSSRICNLPLSKLLTRRSRPKAGSCFQVDRTPQSLRLSDAVRLGDFPYLGEYALILIFWGYLLGKKIRPS